MENYFFACIEESKLSYQHGDVPVGAVIVQNNKIISQAGNTREKNHNVLAHAEINAILLASNMLGRWNLSDCDLYVTLRPCAMCMEVIKQSKIRNVYYLLDKLEYKKDYQKTNVEHVKMDLENEYHEILSHFFKEKRK